MTTRSKIVAAAAAILREGVTSGPSVRAVATRAGVGVGTLRHHFPSQRDLVEAAMESIYADALPDERIHDASVPAEDRLVECISNVVTPLGSSEQARDLWRHIFRAFVDVDPQREGKTGYAAVVRQARLRVESWLAVLEAEGVLPAGDHELRARYLLTVADGLAVGRIFPDDGLSRDQEAAILRAAVGTVLRWP